MKWLIDIVLAAVRAGVKQTTEDGADVNRTFFAAGGEPEIDRGAYIDLYGNEHPDHPGVAALFGEGGIGINTFAPLFDFSIASADGTEQIGFFHDNSNALTKWTKGFYYLQTDEGINTHTQIRVYGKGTGRAYLRIYDEGKDDYFNMFCLTGIGNLSIDGPNTTRFALQSSADIPTSIFYSAAEGETEKHMLYGWKAGDTERRHVDQQISPNANNTALWSGVAHYVFNGNLRATGALISGTKTHAVVGPTDDLDVSDVNTVFLDCSGGNVTIGGFVGGVNGQVLHIIRLCAAVNDATLEHNESTGNQDILLHAGADETLTGEYGGWTLVCNGSHWYDVSHAKHV